MTSTTVHADPGMPHASHAGHSDTADRPLRIGVVSAFPPGRNSLNEYGYHLVRHLTAQHDVAEVIVYSDRPPAGTVANSDQCKPAWTFNSLGNPFSIIAQVRKSRPDAVIFNLQFATFGDRKLAAGLGLLTPLLLRLLGVPTVVILHNLFDNVDLRDAGFARSGLAVRLLKAVGRGLTRALLAADLVAVTIPRYVELLHDTYRADNAVLAPHGSFQPVRLPNLELPAGKRRILAFGKWGTYKTVDVLVEAYELLLKGGYRDLELVIAGADSPNSAGYLAEVANRHRAIPGLTFTGYVAEEDVAGLFESSAVVAFPYSSTTGSSGVLHQAGEFGRAAVLPMLGDLVDIIEEEGFRGVYFEPGNAASLADSLAEVLDNEQLRRDLGRANYLAAAGIPMFEVAHWYVLHIRRLLARANAR